MLPKTTNHSFVDLALVLEGNSCKLIARVLPFLPVPLSAVTSSSCKLFDAEVKVGVTVKLLKMLRTLSDAMDKKVAWAGELRCSGCRKVQAIRSAKGEVSISKVVFGEVVEPDEEE